VVAVLVATVAVAVFLFLRMRSGSFATPSVPNLIDTLPHGVRHITLFANRGDLTLVEDYTPLMRTEDVNILRPEAVYVHALDSVVNYIKKHGKQPVCLYAVFDLGQIFDYALQGAVGGFTQARVHVVVVYFDVPSQQFKVFFDSEKGESFAMKQFEQAVSGGATPLTTW